MDPTSNAPMLLAPGASGSTPLRCPGPESRLPRLDDTLLPEDSPYEILDGERVMFCMGEVEHAGPQAQLAYVLSSLAADGYYALVDLTTRADTVPPPPNLDRNAERFPATVQEFRPDGSILRQGKDPATGDRYLEELSFEVVNTQNMASLRRKAQRLCARGVRRVFAILVKKSQVVEWSPVLSDFVSVVGEIHDATLRVPLSVQALLQAGEADEVVVRSLAAKGNATIRRMRDADLLQGRSEGEAAGLRQAIFVLGEVLGLPLTAEQRGRVERSDLAGLQELLRHLKERRTWPAS